MLKAGSISNRPALGGKAEGPSGGSLLGLQGKQLLF
jgi:hypothetical protein